MTDANLPPDLDPIAARLRSHLRAEAAAVPTETGADWDDVTRRVVRDGTRRRRVLAGALAVALVAGPAAGFLAGRAGDDGAGTAVRAAAPDDDGAPAESDGAGGDGPLLAPGSQGGAPALAPGDDRAAPYGYGFSGGGPGSLELLFTRTTADGVDVRAYRNTEDLDPATYGTGPGGWNPPPQCFPTNAVTAGFSTEAAVGMSGGGIYAALPEPVVVTSSLFGVAEGDPHVTAVVQVDSGATVRLRGADGATDEMAPVSGIAVLAIPTAAPAGAQGWWQPEGTVEVLDAAGAVIATGDLTSAGPAFADECQPPPPAPPALPEPGEQPADVDAARAAVTEAFETTFNGSLTDEDRAPFVEGGEVVATEEIEEGPYAEQVDDSRARVRDLVFTSPTEAAVLYDLVIEDWSDFPNRLGEALLIDGRWQVSRATVCNDLSLAGVACD